MDALPDFIAIRSTRHEAEWECTKCRPVPSAPTRSWTSWRSSEDSCE